MLQLAVTTRFNRVAVDTCVVPLDRPRVVGDAPDSSASFPGPVVEIEPVPGGAQIGPVLLKPGGQLTLDLGEVEVEFTVVRRARMPRERLPSADIRMLVATGALLVFGMWWDTAHRWAYTNPSVVAELEALPAMWSRLRGEPEEVEAGVEATPAVEQPPVQLLE
ncbi:MAG: hypothetical protein H6737_25505 [Alphaproteobacteria bacterium]|nr:hypothetical protein [Alphaproteobacteria bacterium]